MTTKLNLVTVTYRQELAMLRLQAASVSRFLPQGLVKSITIIVNEDGDDLKYCLSYIKDKISPEYGQFKDLIKIVTSEELTRNKQRGYYRQQVLKMMISDHIEDPYYTIMDSKNFFCKMVDSNTFFDGTKPKGMAVNVPNVQKMIRLSADEYSNFFGISLLLENQSTFSIATPSTLCTELVRGMRYEIRQISGRDFDQQFEHFSFKSEFMLYGTYIRFLGKKLDEIYVDAPALAITLWGVAEPKEGAVNSTFERILSNFVPVAGIHQIRARQMEEKDQEAFVYFLNKISLVKEREIEFVSEICSPNN